MVEASTTNSDETAILEVIVYVTNFAPYFRDGAPEKQVIQLESGMTSFEFLIPEVTDQEEGSDNITVSVSNLKSDFIVFDQELMEI